MSSYGHSHGAHKHCYEFYFLLVVCSNNVSVLHHYRDSA